jgi:hypothetical protein
MVPEERRRFRDSVTDRLDRRAQLSKLPCAPTAGAHMGHHRIRVIALEQVDELLRRQVPRHPTSLSRSSLFRLTRA